MIAQAAPVLRCTRYPRHAAKNIMKFFGGLFKGTFSAGASGQKYASIYDENGNMILDYGPTGWTEHPTKDEMRHHSEVTAIYYAAYSQARARIKTEQTAAAGGFDVRT